LLDVFLVKNSCVAWCLQKMLCA